MAFSKLTPPNNTTNLSNNIIISWTNSANATSYEYCYDTTNDGTCSNWLKNNADTNATLIGLLFNTTYYWQVRARNGEDVTVANDEVWWSFTTQPAPVKKIFNSVASQDGWVLESSETSNLGGKVDYLSTTFNVGDDATKKQYRGILSFSTGAALPDNAVITKVTLNVKKQATSGTGDPFTLFQGMMVDMKSGFFGTAASLATSDFQLAAGKSFGPFKPVPANGWYSFDLTPGKAIINKLASGSGLTQIRLRFKLDDNNNTVANYVKFYSGNYGTASLRPQLIIEYYVP